MPEQEPYKEVKKTKYGTRVMQSLKATVIGLLIFVLSFAVLFWNEGRTDMSKVADDATPISAEEMNADANLNGAQVSVEGTLKTAESLGDGEYIKPGKYLSLNRKVEVYAWKEIAHSTTTTAQVGGEQTTETTYSVVESDIDVTIFGKLNGDKISPFFDKKNNKLFEAFTGTADSAVAELSQRHKTSTWVLRLIGFMMMWIGLSTLLGPIYVILDVIHIAGQLSKSLIKFISFIVALVLSTVTILISMILHNIWLVILLIAALVGGGYYLYSKKKDDDGEKKSAEPKEKKEENKPEEPKDKEQKSEEPKEKGETNEEEE